MKKSGKLAFHVVNSNVAIGSLPTLCWELYFKIAKSAIMTQKIFMLISNSLMPT